MEVDAYRVASFEVDCWRHMGCINMSRLNCKDFSSTRIENNVQSLHLQCSIKKTYKYRCASTPYMTQWEKNGLEGGYPWDHHGCSHRFWRELHNDAVNKKLHIATDLFSGTDITRFKGLVEAIEKVGLAGEHEAWFGGGAGHPELGLKAHLSDNRKKWLS